MDSKETVTMYQISKELAFETNRDFVKKDEDGNLKILEEKRNAFDNYKKERVNDLEKLLKVKGINKNAIKVGREFAIPVESKDYIKFLLLNFTSSPVKAIRKNGLENLPYSQWIELLNGLVEYSSKEIQDVGQKEKKRNEILAQHQYFSIERHQRLIDKFSGLLKEAELRYGSFEVLGNNSNASQNQTVKEDSIFDKSFEMDSGNYKARLLSENDVVVLYDYLEKMIYQCFFEFGEVADIFSDIRENEIEDKVILAINENINPDEIVYDDSNNVLEKALEEYQKSRRSKRTTF
ncbi:hypothetical protein [Bacillus subtilis]|uniref:hypothetical protein n=1 Tax=Bacillus subtilis TaxID=1423 RepID=UPI003F827D59